jgi:hypothetical protein
VPTITKAVRFGDPVRINALLDQPGKGAVKVAFRFRQREADLQVYCEDAQGTKAEKEFDEVTTTMGGGHATISWRAAGPKRGEQGSALIYCQAIVGEAAPVEVAFQEWLVYYDTVKITATNADGGAPMRREAVELRPAGKDARPILGRTDDQGVVVFQGVPPRAFEVVWLDCNVEGDYDTPLHHGGEHTVSLRKPPVKVAIHWPPTGADTHKQLVNLAAGVAGHPEFGPSLPLVLRTTEGVPSGPVEVHIKATFGDKNLRRTHTDGQVRPHAQLPAGFARQGDGSWLWTKTVALAEWQDAGDGKREVTIPITIGSCGGDTVTLGASTVKENTTPTVKVENWRQVFYNAFATDPLKQKLVDALAATNASLAPHFIRIADARTADGAPSTATVDSIPANIASTLVVDGAKRWFDTSKNELFRNVAFKWLNNAALSTRRPQLLRIHMVDYFFTPPGYTRVTVDVKKGKATYTAPLGKNLAPGADAVKPDNATRGGSLIDPPKFGVPVISADRKTVTVDVKASGAEQAELKVKEASTYRGFTSLDLDNGGPPVFGLRPETNLSSTLYTLRHEFAHAFDEVKEDSSRAVEGYEHPAHPFRVVMQGWTGTHCVFGLKEKLPASEQATFNKDRVAHYGNEYHAKKKFGTCLMWGTGFGDEDIQHQPNDFCEHCAKAVRANRFGRA